MTGTPIQIEIPDPYSVFTPYTYSVLKDYTTPEFTEYGGAGSGKSHGVYQRIVAKAMDDWAIPRRIIVWRKIRATLKDSSFQHVKDVLGQFGILQYCKINKSDLIITLPNKAEILFKGLDDPEKAKSLKGVSDNVLEELTEFTLDDYTQIKMRTRDREHKHRQTFSMFNPVSKLSWVYDYFFIQKDHGSKVHHSTYKDNPFLDAVYCADLEKLKERNPAYYKIYALGEFATLDKLVIPQFTKRLVSAEELNGLKMYAGLDFGYINDPSAFVVTYYDKTNRRIYVTQEYVKENLLNNAIAQTIKALGYTKEVISADSAEQKSIEEIRLLGISRIKPVKKGPDSVIQGIQWLNQHEIIVDERCFKTIEELENYTWKKNKDGTWGGKDGKTPVDTYNHTIDAIRYALEDEIRSNNKPKLSFGNAL